MQALQTSFANLRLTLATVNAPTTTTTTTTRRGRLKELLRDLLPPGRNDITPPELKERADIKARLNGKTESEFTENGAMRFFWLADVNHDYLLVLDEWVDAFLPSVGELDDECWENEQLELQQVAEELRKGR